MLSINDFSPEQYGAVGRGLKWPASMILLDVGLGKTAVALTVIKERMEKFEITGALVVAPLRVCQAVWHREAPKWDHLTDLTFSLVWGDRFKRMAALEQEADIYLINYENLAWLVQYCEARGVEGWEPPFQMVIFDEVSRMANSQGIKSRAWFRSLMQRSWFKYTMGLTATPATNGLMKLFGEYKCLDAGKSLGSGVEAFRHRYFYRSDYTKRYIPYGGAKDRIFDRVKHMTYAVENKGQAIPVVERIIEVKLAPRAKEQYDQLEEDFFTELENMEEVEVFTAAALSNKLLQFCNGAIYLGSPDERPRRSAVVHDHKLEALDELVDQMQGHPLVVGYSYKLDRYRIKERYPKLKVMDVQEYKDAAKLIDEFPELDILTGHPASFGHGIDGLQHHTNHLCWFGSTYDLELDIQANGRVARQGQKKQVYIHRIMVENSIDQVVLDALQGKAKTQADFVGLLRNYSKEHHNGKSN